MTLPTFSSSGGWAQYDQDHGRQYEEEDERNEYPCAVCGLGELQGVDAKRCANCGEYLLCRNCICPCSGISVIDKGRRVYIETRPDCPVAEDGCILGAPEVVWHVGED